MADGLNPIGNLLGKVNAQNELVVSLEGGSPTFTTVTATTVNATGAFQANGVPGVTGSFDLSESFVITVTDGIITAITPA